MAWYRVVSSDIEWYRVVSSVVGRTYRQTVSCAAPRPGSRCPYSCASGCRPASGRSTRTCWLSACRLRRHARDRPAPPVAIATGRRRMRRQVLPPAAGRRHLRRRRRLESRSVVHILTCYFCQIEYFCIFDAGFPSGPCRKRRRLAGDRKLTVARTQSAAHFPSSVARNGNDVVCYAVKPGGQAERCDVQTVDHYAKLRGLTVTQRFQTNIR